MSLILNIDTSSAIAHVSIAEKGIIIQSVSNTIQKELAAFLQPAIRNLLKNSSCNIIDIEAVAVIIGPGSYTGLRIGLACAKALCYALHKPLITLNILEVMAASAIHNMDKNQIGESHLYCPMLDARKNEVFTAVYDRELNCHLLPCALIINSQTLNEIIGTQPVLLFASGAFKWKDDWPFENAFFDNVSNLPESMCFLSARNYGKFVFSDLAYSEPLYLKEAFIIKSQKP